jgi:ectoine hydroxylase-related dioxygenase (phytanoyl-CoA dioxygenase family)
MLDADRQRHLAQITEQGFTILPDVVPGNLMDALNDALLELEQRLQIEPGHNSFEGHRTIRIYNLLAHQAVFAEVPVQPDVLSIVEGVLDDGALVSSLSSISIDPGEAAQPLHADDTLMGIDRPHAPLVCNSMWALTDFTEENGATRVVPGSHRWPKRPVYGATYPSVPAEMTKGSVLIWNGSLWHGGGANRSAARRVGVAMNYCAGFIRQQENQQLGIPLERIREFSPRLQQLIGFGTYKHLIGHIDKASPSQRLLGVDDQFRSVWDII